MGKANPLLLPVVALGPGGYAWRLAMNLRSYLNYRQVYRIGGQGILETEALNLQSRTGLGPNSILYGSVRLVRGWPRSISSCGIKLDVL